MRLPDAVLDLLRASSARSLAATMPDDPPLTRVRVHTDGTETAGDGACEHIDEPFHRYPGRRYPDVGGTARHRVPLRVPPVRASSPRG